MWELGYKKSWVLKNWCFWTVVLEKTLESPLDSKKIQPVHPKEDQSWVFIGRTDVEVETPILWPPDVKSILKKISPGCSLEGLMLKLKLQYFGHLTWRADWFERPWCWKVLRAGEGDDRGWNGWMASLTQWTWVWVDSGSWWWTGRPGVLWFMGSQRVRHDWVTELNWYNIYISLSDLLHSVYWALCKELQTLFFYCIV